METKTIIIIAMIVTIIALVFISVVNGYKFSLTSYLVGWIGCTLLGVILDHNNPKSITIEKSSDSEWVKSDKDYGDTTITEVRIMEHEGKIDTIYPTTIYKRIEL